MTLARDDSLARWAAALVARVSDVDADALDVSLDRLASATLSARASSRWRTNTRGGRRTHANRREVDRGVDDLDGVTVGDVAKTIAKTTDLVDPRVFEVPRDNEHRPISEVWATINARRETTTTTTTTRDGVKTADGRMLSLPSLSTMSFRELTAALAEEGEKASEAATRGRRAATKKTTTKTTTKTKTSATTAVKTRMKRSRNGVVKTTATSEAKMGRRTRIKIDTVAVPTVPGVSYAPMKLKRRSNIPTPAIRRALAPKKMGRRPKDAPEETAEEKTLRAQERLFRNRESAARSREKRLGALRALEDENAQLKGELTRLKNKLAKYERANP